MTSGLASARLLADGARLLVRRERLRRMAGVILDPGDAVEAFRHGRAVGGVLGVRSGQAARGGRAPACRTPAPRSTRRSPPADRRRRSGSAPALQLGRGVGIRLGRQGQTQLQPALERRQRLGLRADLGRQLADVVIRLPEGRARAAVGLTLEQVFEPLIEVGRAAEQLGSQAVELLLLEQQVLADPAVERLDRLQRQIEASPLSCVGEQEVAVGVAGALIGLGQVEVGRLERCVGAGLDERARRRARRSKPARSRRSRPPSSAAAASTAAPAPGAARARPTPARRPASARRLRPGPGPMDIGPPDAGPSPS